jgi:hypothetical protein
VLLRVRSRRPQLVVLLVVRPLRHCLPAAVLLSSALLAVLLLLLAPVAPHWRRAWTTFLSP